MPARRAGSSRMLWPRAEAHAAAAAGKAGTVYILSTLSGTPLEEVKAATTGPCWFQLYLCGGRDVALGGIARAKAAGFFAIVVTIDTPVAGMRERDVRNGTRQLLSGKPMTMLPHLPQMLVCPRWLYDFFADGGLMSFPNVMLADGPMKYAEVGAALGARAVLLGRGYSYGLAALGEAGATRAAEIFRADLLRTMKLLGWRLEEGPRRRCGSRQSSARRGTAPRAAVRRGP